MTATEHTGHAGGASWIDSHCHLHDEGAPDGADDAVDDAREHGVVAMITVGCDRHSSQAAIAVADAHRDVYATVGLHPHDASQGVDSIRDLVATPGIVAIGEAGLDYYYDHSPRDVQRRAFAEQIAIAHERRLPLVIHTRDAWADTFDVLDAEGVPERTVFHCFTGGPGEARACLDRGAHLSFSGIVTFKNAADVRAAAVVCPLDRMLVETDSPYLAPVPHRGKRNRPSWVGHVGTAIAELRDRAVDEVAAATRTNTEQVFSLRLGSRPTDPTRG